MDKHLERIKNFFDVDMKVKEELYNLAPKSEDEYNEETKMKYIDGLEQSLKYIKRMLENIEKEFNISMDNSSISNFFRNSNTKLAEFDYKNGDLKKIYQQILSDMDTNLVSEVNENCFGYSIFNSPYGLVEKCKTVNELLHVYHSYIVNNENFYKTIPRQCNPKTNEEGYDVTLYGMENDLAKEIFDNFPLDMECGDVDILALDNRVLMMLRDRGHALTIELLQNEEGYISTNYFIPKICNKEMVNNLKGVTKVDDSSKFAKGMFDSKREEILGDLFTFINGVPTDKDIILRPLNEEILINDGEETNIEQKEEVKDYDISQEELLSLSKGRFLSKVKESFEKVIGTVKSRGKEINENEYTRNE